MKSYTHRQLPPYAYIPGRFPHPVSDPAGHMHGLEPEQPPPLDPDAWQANETYLYGVDLFNHGYYWESHEAWESLWHAAGRRGPTAEFLKGLIKLAAAGVKALEGNPRGVERHLARACELLEPSSEFGRYCGMDVRELRTWLLQDRVKDSSNTVAQVVSPLEWRLLLGVEEP